MPFGEAMLTKQSNHCVATKNLIDEAIEVRKWIALGSIITLGLKNRETHLHASLNETKWSYTLSFAQLLYFKINTG